MRKLFQKLGRHLRASMVAFALVAGAASQAQALSFDDLPTVRSKYDSAGMNWVNGLARYEGPSISIGQPGAGGLSYSRNYTEVVNAVAVWSDAYTAKLYNDGAVSGLFVVAFDGRIETFFVAGTGTERASLQYTGARLSWANSPNPDYEYITRDGDRLAFDMTTATEGRLISITAANGAVATLTYTDSAGLSRLQSVTNNFGYHLKFEYQSNSTGSPAAWQTLAKVTAINGAVDYCAPTANDCAGVLTQAWPYLTYAESGSYATSLTHTTTDNLSRATVAVFNAYRLASITSPSTSVITYSPPSTAGGVTSRQVSNGTDTSTYAYKPYSAPHPWREMNVTDPMGGLRTTFFDDWALHVLSDTDQVGRTTTYSYLHGPLSETVFPDGRKETYSYDARANLEDTTRIAVSGSGLADIVTSATYDATCTGSNFRKCNKPLTTTDARGEVTTYEYSDVHGGLETVTLPAPTTTPPSVQPQERTSYSGHYAYIKNSGGAIVQAPGPIYLADTVSACVTSGPTTCSSAADEVVVAVAYGATGVANNLLPTSTTQGPGTGVGAATTAVTYDVFGNLLTVDGPLPGSADTTVHRYDDARRRVVTIGPDTYYGGHGAVRTTYNVMNQPTLVEAGRVGSQLPIYWYTFTPMTTSATEYDSLNRVAFQKVIEAGGSTVLAVTQYSYDANGQVSCVARRMNPAAFGSLPPSACTPGAEGANGPDQITYAQYNAAGQVEPVVVAYGTALEHDLEASTYDVNGNVFTRTDANGNLTQYEYDGHARLYRVYYPDKTTPLTPSTMDYEQYGYDANGNLISLRLRDNTTVTYTYDALNRQKTGMQSSTYDYDNLSRLTSTSRSGRTVSYTYDAFGNVLSETQPAGTVGYEYDVAGRRTKMSWPDGKFVTYDWYGGPDMLTQDIGGGYSANLTSYVYDELGRITRAGRSNGTYTDYAFDDRSALETLVTNLGGAGGDQTAGFSRDAGTRIIGRTTTNGVYDWAPGSASPTTYANNGLNQTIAAGGLTLTYDDRGNMTSDGVSSYSYDVGNRMTGMSRTGASATLAYDPVGRLYELAPSGGTTTRFLYDGADLIAEYDASGNMLRRYVHGPGVDEPAIWYEGASTSGNQWYLHADERGSVIAVSQAASVLSTATYDAYGARSTTDPAYTPRFGFTGQAWLSELGLYYYKARMYSPALGRFLQTDPIGYGDGMNLYAYVGNDPVNATDPTGTDYYRPIPGGYRYCVSEATDAYDESVYTPNGNCTDYPNFDYGGFDAPWNGDGSSGDSDGGWAGLGGGFATGGLSPTPGSSDNCPTGPMFTISPLGFGATGFLGVVGLSGSVALNFSVPTTFFSTGDLRGSQVYLSASVTGLGGLGAYAGAGPSYGYSASQQPLKAGFSRASAPVLQGGAAYGGGAEFSAQIGTWNGGLGDSSEGFSASGSGGARGGVGAYAAVGAQGQLNLSTPQLGC